MPDESSDSQDQKRKNPRAVAKIEVEFKATMDFAKSYMLNVSNGGLFIRTDEPFHLDSIVFLKFLLPEDSEAIEAEGKVVWCNAKGGRSYFPRGMGIKFLKIKPTDAERISKFVKEHQTEIESHSFL